MAIKPLTQWRCDVCRKAIETAGDGYVTWHTDDDLREHGFKIIHQGPCDDNEAGASAALTDFLGTDGLNYLMAMLSYGPLKKGNAAGPKDMNEFVDLVRRVQSPYYEEARVRFSDPDVRAHRSDWNEVVPYMEGELKALSEGGE